MDTERGQCTLITLPEEIQNKVFDELVPLDLIPLRGTCQHFRNILAPTTMLELVAAESTETATQRDVYACCLCLCLRHSSEFADQMKKKHRKRGEGYSRFCVQCGLKPLPGQNGYGRGSHITIKGVVSVLCMFCVRFMPPAKDLEGKNSNYCLQCWPRTPGGRERRRWKEARLVKQQESREERRRLRRQWAAASDTEWDTDEDAEEGIDLAFEIQSGLSLEESDRRDIFD